MVMRIYKAYTPGLRTRTISQFKAILASKATRRRLMIGYQRHHGRNQRGVITCRHRGGGHKRLYRVLDFKRQYRQVWGRVIRLEYDPNRNARICLIRYVNGQDAYMLHPRGLQVHDVVIAGEQAPIALGNALPLSAV